MTTTIKRHEKAKEKAQFIVKELLNDQVVELTHDAQFLSIQKMVSIVELVKKELEDKGKTYYQYNKVSQEKSTKRTREDQIGPRKVPRVSSASSVADSSQRREDLPNSPVDSRLAEHQISNSVQKSTLQVKFSISLSLFPQSKYSDWTLQTNKDTNKDTKQDGSSEPEANGQA